MRYFVAVEGYSKTNGKLWEEPITAIAIDAPPIEFACQGCTPFVQVCRWTCNGTNYAWDIQQYKDPNSNASHFTLSQAYNYFDDIEQVAIPYYYYLPIHLLSDFPYDPTYIKITQPFNTNTTTGSFCSPGNSPISGNVFGVAKDIGKWKDGVVSTSGGQPLNTGDICLSNDRISMINFMNNHADFTNSVGNSSLPDPLDPLACHPSFCGVNFSGGSTGVNGGNSPIEDCRATNLSFNLCQPGEVAPGDCDGGFTQMTEAFFDCVSAPQPNLNPNQGISRILITDLNGESGINRTKSVEVKFNEQKGEWHMPNLPKSLYAISILFNDGQNLPMVKEFSFTNKTPKEREKANSLEVHVIPVPVVGTHFDLQLKAEERLKFRYELFDNYGIKRYEKDFVMQKNEETTITINPITNMPTGLLMHRFIFMDGSYKSIESIKL